MKHLLLVLLCFTVQAAPVRTIDGDTFTADVRIWLGLTARETVRLLGVRAPEPRGATREAGVHAGLFAARWLAQGDVTITTCGRDFLGRILADVTRGESNLGKELIEAGLATEDRR